MSFFSYALGAIVLIFVLLRQVRVVPVPRAYHPRLPIILGVIGLLELTSYAGDHHVSSTAWAWVLGTMLVGALGLGALRGLSMRVWATNGWVVRQGTAVTMALWLVSVLVHFVGDAGSTHSGGAGLLGASFLLYLGLTLGMQYYLVYRRAQPLWAAARPPGRPTAAGALHPGTGGVLRHLPRRRRRAVRMGAHQRPRAAARRPRTSSTRRSWRKTTTTGRPSCPRRTDRPYTRSSGDGTTHLQPAALRRPARLDRDPARPSRRLGRLGGGRVLRAGRGPG